MMIPSIHKELIMPITHNLGFPRIGAQRELKFALEPFWRGEINEQQLHETGKALRAAHWRRQQEAGIDLIPVGDFAYYDHVLNTSMLLGAIPKRFGEVKENGFDTYFALARGTKTQPALEMTKWFDTNYHYLVPEFDRDTEFRIACDWLFKEIDEAQTLNLNIKPVLLSPLTYLYLGKTKDPNFDRLTLLPKLLPVYQKILQKLKTLGIEWVQLDDPALVLDLPVEWKRQLAPVYQALSKDSPKILLTTYFSGVESLADEICALPVDGIHLDLTRAPQHLDRFLRNYPTDKILSLGVVDGRNIWRCDLQQALTLLEKALQHIGDRLWLAPGCSLLHCPIDLDNEHKLNPEIKNWLAFSQQKLNELVILKRGLTQGKAAISHELSISAECQRSRTVSSLIHRAEVKARLSNLPNAIDKRKNEFAKRQLTQKQLLNLPAFPTTTIGSFPQTEEIRHARKEFKQGLIDENRYKEKIREQIKIAVSRQEEIGLDVLVHGEAERNDMVEYFGEYLHGFAFTENGWVQSYGSRCVKPPIIYGDVVRPQPMTIEWIRYAQSLTEKPMKGMLTGPITILQWSFVRDDQPRSETALQIALAIRDEVIDLEESGIQIIQIDEPAFREGLPLKKDEWENYLKWASRAFRIASSSVNDTTQIHTHMCYCEFNDILPAIASLDADVITIETSRSDMELLNGFGEFHYPNAIGPGVYDIHSPRIPETDEILKLLNKARSVISDEQLWVNPDCGLKTRNWNETKLALQRMVNATKILREACR
jgi:5-methyltetrahydropteroyltriglutamate--homocysteine methyltransferase